MIAPPRCSLALLVLPATVGAFSAPLLMSSATTISTTLDTAAKTRLTAKDDPPHFMDYLKFDGNPTFDVVEKTKEYVSQQPNVPESYFAEEYVLRGPVIGPLTRKDLTEAQAGFEYDAAFPDITTDAFGFVQDPENPYRCLWFEKWRATHTGPLKAGPQTLDATGNRMVTPLMTFFVVWNPDGKIVYESVGNVVDRHEGNTEGKGAVFGLFQTAGLDIPAQPGSKLLQFQQRLGHLLGFGKSFSEEEKIPKWWKSESRGADPIDPEASGM